MAKSSSSVLYHSEQRTKGLLGKEVKMQKTGLFFWGNSVILRGNCPKQRKEGVAFQVNISDCHRNVQINLHTKIIRIFSFFLNIWLLNFKIIKS